MVRIIRFDSKVNRSEFHFTWSALDFAGVWACGRTDSFKFMTAFCSSEQLTLGDYVPWVAVMGSGHAYGSRCFPDRLPYGFVETFSFQALHELSFSWPHYMSLKCMPLCACSHALV